MSHYAQADTHFILSIYDHLRNELLSKSRAPSPDPDHADASAPPASNNPQRAMREVLDLSARTALRMWTPLPYDTRGASSAGWMTNFRKKFPIEDIDSATGFRYERIWAWRDQVARAEDVGLG